MTSEVEERPKLVTASYGQHRSQWVNWNFQRGGGLKKPFRGGGMDIFWNYKFTLNALEELLFKMLGMGREDGNAYLVCKRNWLQKDHFIESLTEN